jgi:Protein of unknown function (DUF736)
MANIGSFKKVNAEFQGEIVTLSVQARNVRIVPESSRTNDNAPSHRVFVGRADYAESSVMRSDSSWSAVFRAICRRSLHIIPGMGSRGACGAAALMARSDQRDQTSA